MGPQRALVKCTGLQDKMNRHEYENEICRVQCGGKKSNREMKEFEGKGEEEEE